MSEKVLYASTIVEHGMPLVACLVGGGKATKAEFVPTSKKGTHLIRQAAQALVSAGVDPESDGLLMVFEPSTERYVKWHTAAEDDYWHVWYPEFGE